MSLIDVLINTICALLRAIFSILPNYSSAPIPQSFFDGVTWITTTSSQWNKVLPIDTAFVVVIFIMGFEAIYWGFKFTIFLYDKTRGSG